MKNPKILIRAFVLGITLLSPSISSANECYVEFSKTNICEYAKKVQRELSPNLPMQLSENLYLRSVLAVGPQVALNVMLNYSESFFIEAIQAQGVSRVQIDNQMKNFTFNSICSDPALEAFVGLGGEIIYSYKFKDGKKYLEIFLDKETC